MRNFLKRQLIIFNDFTNDNTEKSNLHFNNFEKPSQTESLDHFAIFKIPKYLETVNFINRIYRV